MIDPADGRLKSLVGGSDSYTQAETDTLLDGKVNWSNANQNKNEVKNFSANPLPLILSILLTVIEWDFRTLNILMSLLNQKQQKPSLCIYTISIRVMLE